MLTGEIRNQIDRIWNAFWSGGISNPLEVIEQITYLLFLKRLDDLHTLEENKAARLKTADRAAHLSRRASDPKGRPYEDLRWSRFKHFAAARDVHGRQRARVPVPPHAGRRRLHLRASHEGRPLHDPHAGAAGQGRGHARPRADGRPRHQGRPLRVHARQDCHRRAERPVPHAAAHHPADGRDDGAAAQGRRSATRPAAPAASSSPLANISASTTRDSAATPSCRSTSTTACSTASTSTTPCSASAA